MKGIPPTYTQPGFQTVMAHPKHRCSSSVEGMNLLQTPSEQQAPGHRWATNILQKFEGKSPAFTLFCDLRRGGEGLQRTWGYLWGSPKYLSDSDTIDFLDKVRTLDVVHLDGLDGELRTA